MFLSQTRPNDPANARLLIVDGHGSYIVDEFMIIYYLNNIYILFLSVYTSYILQSLDLGCFSSLKIVYRRFLGKYLALTNTTKVRKANFLEFYTKVREIGLREKISDLNKKLQNYILKI